MHSNHIVEVIALLLENGGNPNHLISCEGESIFEYIDFKVSYDEYTHDYLHTVQCWSVLMAYGACLGDNGGSQNPNTDFTAKLNEWYNSRR